MCAPGASRWRTVPDPPRAPLVEHATPTRLKLRPGEHVHVKLQHSPERNRVDALPKWDFVGDVDIDAILDEEFEA